MGHKGGLGEKGRTGGFGFPGTVNIFIKILKLHKHNIYHTFSLLFVAHG